MLIFLLPRLLLVFFLDYCIVVVLSWRRLEFPVSLVRPSHFFFGVLRIAPRPAVDVIKSNGLVIILNGRCLRPCTGPRCASAASAASAALPRPPTVGVASSRATRLSFRRCKAPSDLLLHAIHRVPLSAAAACTRTCSRLSIH